MPAFAKTITAAFVAAATLIAASPAFADSFQSNGKTMEVRYGDLDLTKDAGQAELKGRLFHAATRVCPSSDFREVQACRKLALRNIKEPMRTAIAMAESRARFADASATKPMVGN